MNKRHTQMVPDLSDYLASGAKHSTMVGKIIALGEGPEKDRKSAWEFAQYFVEMLIEAENYRKSNVNATSYYIK